MSQHADGHTDSETLLRSRGAHEHSRVTFVELFFDLVFVFAVTQLSHFLLEHLTLVGAFRTALLLMAVWWAWIYTSWITNWLDPDRAPIRLALFVLMLAGLLLSVSLPYAFTSRGLTFALAYAFIQIGRTLFMLWALGPHDQSLTRNFQRILVWLTVSGVFWIAGGIAQDGLRAWLWLIALAIEYASPSLGFWVPGLGRSITTDWDVEGNHLAERCALFVIIALGESILVIGATFSELALTPAVIAAFLISFLSSIGMWWIYFNVGAEAGSQAIAASRDPGRLARSAYTYLQLPIIAGIILTAVADELVLKHPTSDTDLGTAIAIIGGPGLYLLGTLLFRWTTTGNAPRSHMAGCLALLASALLSPAIPILALSATAAFILVAVAVLETIAPGASRSHAKPG